MGRSSSGVSRGWSVEVLANLRFAYQKSSIFERGWKCEEGGFPHVAYPLIFKVKETNENQEMIL